MPLKWEPYDPSWLATLAHAQQPDLPWMAEAFAGCTTVAWKVSRRSSHGRRVKDKIYAYFVSPEAANQPGADRQFDSGVWLLHPTEGNLLVDILTGHRVSGVEFYDRLFANPVAGRGKP